MGPVNPIFSTRRREPRVLPSQCYRCNRTLSVFFPQIFLGRSEGFSLTLSAQDGRRYYQVLFEPMRTLLWSAGLEAVHPLYYLMVTHRRAASTKALLVVDGLPSHISITGVCAAARSNSLNYRRDIDHRAPTAHITRDGERDVPRSIYSGEQDLPAANSHR